MRIIWKRTIVANGYSVEETLMERKRFDWREFWIALAFILFFGTFIAFCIVYGTRLWPH